MTGRRPCRAGTGPQHEPDTDGPEPPALSCVLTDPGRWSRSRTGRMCLNGAEVTALAGPRPTLTPAAGRHLRGRGPGAAPAAVPPPFEA